MSQKTTSAGTAEEPQAIGAVGRLPHRVAGPLQEEPEQAADVGVVVDHQDVSQRGPRGRGAGGRVESLAHAAATGPAFIHFPLAGAGAL